MKDSKYYKRRLSKKIDFNNGWITKLLLSIIIVLICLIVTNFNINFRNVFKREVLEENIKFNKFNEFYKKIMIDGDNDSNESIVVSNNDIKEYEEIDGKYKFLVDIDTPIEVLKGGIIVYIGIKDNLNTVIVQGNDGVDIWYSNISNVDYSLYDYVSKRDILGSSNDYYLISIYKDGDILKYDEYLK